MNIFPAIDLREGRVVRLTQGDYDRMEVYGDSPVDMAAAFRARGASFLHMVDLDGARDGTTANRDSVAAVAAAGGLFIQVGGGVRTEERIASYLELGVDRVILGTVAAENFAFAEKMAAKYGPAIAVGVDAKDGFVAIRGWKELTALQGVEFCRRLAEAGVETVIYTDISRDGAMQGTNLEVYRVLSQVKGLNVVASGGVSSYEEIEALRDLGLYGTILGKALYTGTLELEKAIALARPGGMGSPGGGEGEEERK
ncbi:MAG: 1-(5-phosphoribosyl)-5-[(5-phosphoribosylamino)methylideneamino]imidazole-4-carboxamide isomerase [Bacillota bacterium]|nr:1-(5-phosphoribosyl)-5-[(5-phosphoribosylamino)methylideneamino]imidazole-4-carboxamide isomerase [Bacillota bacterium]